jgi:hypothetical protein
VTRDDIIRMAREAGFEVEDLDGTAEVLCDGYFIQTDAVEKFAALVAAAEREACAKVCDYWTGRNDISGALLAIRARGK